MGPGERHQKYPTSSYRSESIPQTYALCKSDMMISQKNQVIFVMVTQSEDQFSGDRFDYMITNPIMGTVGIR